MASYLIPHKVFFARILFANIISITLHFAISICVMRRRRPVGSIIDIWHQNRRIDSCSTLIYKYESRQGWKLKGIFTYFGPNFGNTLISIYTTANYSS
jgi:hypothetical protein